MNTEIFFISLPITFCVTLLMTKKLIPVLSKRKIGQKILEIGPNWHESKNGTPTMGGISFVFASLVAFALMLTIVGTQLEEREISIMINVFTYGLFNAIIGAIDDIAKIRKRKNEGLTPRGKLVLQSVASILFLIMMKKTVGLSTALLIPFTKFQLELGFLYYVFAFFLLCGITNAVNLTDGIDGLASTCVMTVGAFFVFVSLTKTESASLSFLGGVLLGTSLAFLIYNLHPAKIFMGDTGSLFYGGLIVSSSFLLDSPLLVLLYGFCFLFEAISVIMQVTYFKITRGKRLFKMAPIHHHLEKIGFSEMKIVYVFGALSILSCAVAYFGV